MYFVIGKWVDRGEDKDLSNKIPQKIPQQNRCKLCMNELHSQGHKEMTKKKKKMNKHSFQCQKCTEVMCENNLSQICHNCLE